MERWPPTPFGYHSSGRRRTSCETAPTSWSGYEKPSPAPVGTADVVTVLAGQVASLLAANAGPDGDPEALFDTMIRAQIDMVRRMNAIETERADG
ncbi:hypothetical protein SHXM_10020 [Streptomyces hygroscopicus]|nr:hypothetical protein SHXM_10020 [Streptomyces hygroscopicus]